MHNLVILVIILSLFATASTCRKRNSDAVTVALSDKFSTFDTLTSTSSDAAAERVRNLMFNALVKKDGNFDYIGELANEIVISGDGRSIALTLRDGVKFHNGQEFTSADVKYTFDELFKSGGYKAGAFFDTVPVEKSRVTLPTAEQTTPMSAKSADNVNNAATQPTSAKAPPPIKTKQVPHIESIATPDTKTVVFTVTRPALRHILLSNLVAIPIIPQGSAASQKEQPIGSGPFRFVNFNASQNLVELAAFPEYWEGSPKVAKLVIKTITDASGLQAELQTGAVDLAPNPSNLPPDILRILGGLSNLKVEQSEGSNIQYLGMNTQSPPLDNVKVRQAIGYAIDREKIIKELLAGQAHLAHSILPAASWAYSAGTTYSVDTAKSKQLLAEAGYKNEPIKFKYAAGNAAFGQYAQAIQNSLTEIGLNVEIETLDPGTLREQLKTGAFQINTGVWVGGNSDPIFMRDLFSSTKIPGGSVSCCNRSRYVNAEVDRLVEDAINEIDQNKRKEIYGKVWEIVSSELPLLPLWYPSNIVVANKRIGNIKIGASGDWSFIKDITVDN